jgi:sterol desaturase/sphingolipid hydroxylase (fatty acid hydroxylase superfamily)
LVIWGLYIPIIAFMLYYSNVVRGIKMLPATLIFLGGMFVWSFFEYVLHRFVFHFFAESDRAKRIVYVLHGNHHEYPRDKERLFMPPVPSLIISSAFFALFFGLFSIFGAAGFAFAFFPGFVLGYLMYGTMHYAIHAWNPPFKWMKPLWRNHHLHHYKDTEQGFGVSSTLWDLVFGTMFDLKKEKEDTAKVKELMFSQRSSKKEFQEQ